MKTITDEDISSINIYNQLLVYPKEVVTQYTSNENIIHILSEFGISKGMMPGINFRKENRGGFQNLADYCLSGVDSIEEYEDAKNYLSEFTLIAECNNCYISLNNKKEVVYVDIEELSDRYVNKSLDEFIYSAVQFSLLINQKTKDADRNLPVWEAVTENDAEDFWNELEQMDEDAVDEDAFWITEVKLFLEDLD